MSFKSDGKIVVVFWWNLFSHTAAPIFAYLTHLSNYRNNPLFSFLSLSMSFVICTCIPAAFDFRASCKKSLAHLQLSLSFLTLMCQINLAAAR
jgi:hypothetical protein